MKIRRNIIGMILICTLFAGCASNPMVAIYDNSERIASNTNTFNLDAVDQEISDGKMSASVERMEGMDTIWSFSSEENIEVDIIYNISVYSGKLKMVFISPDGEINIIRECDSKMEAPVQNTLNIQDGENRIKLVADKDTKFDIEVSIKEGDFSRIGF